MTIGPPADIYALGAVGFFLLTGRELFPGTAPIEILSNHLTAEPPALSPVVGRAVADRLENTLVDASPRTPVIIIRMGTPWRPRSLPFDWKDGGRMTRRSGGQTTGQRHPLKRPMLTTRVRSSLSTYSRVKVIELLCCPDPGRSIRVGRVCYVTGCSSIER